MHVCACVCLVDCTLYFVVRGGVAEEITLRKSSVSGRTSQDKGQAIVLRNGERPAWPDVVSRGMGQAGARPRRTLQTMARQWGVF